MKDSFPRRGICNDLFAKRQADARAPGPDRTDDLPLTRRLL
jgi:hypothetical protein